MRPCPRLDGFRVAAAQRNRYPGYMNENLHPALLPAGLRDISAL